MSPLPTGNYQIRWIPPYTSFPFLGGVYATGEKVKEQILAKPLDSPGDQTWGIRPVDSKDNIYSITFPIESKFPGGGPGPVIPGWSASDDVVTLNFSITEWNITQIDSENNVYRITEANSNRPPSVVVVDNNELFVRPDSPETVSQWQFIAVNRS